MSCSAGRVAGLVALALVACDDAPPDRPALARNLTEGQVARVADDPIAGETVRAIAAAQGTTLAVARERAIRDALFAAEARARGRVPKAAESALLARVLLEQRLRELSGPATDEELAAATQRHWLELDRPEGARVVHAVVLVPMKPPATPAQWESAEVVAKAIADASSSAAAMARNGKDTDGAVLDELKRAVSSVDARGLSAKAEPLDAVAADGRVLKPGGGTFVVEFAATVAKLKARGDVTPPFRTPFGVHVAILLERTPPVAVPAEERRALVHDEVVDGRLAHERKAITDRLASSVEVASNAAALLELVSVGAAEPAVAARPE